MLLPGRSSLKRHRPTKTCTTFECCGTIRPLLVVADPLELYLAIKESKAGAAADMKSLIEQLRECTCLPIEAALL